MNKDTFYFSHDCNARTDEKILALRLKHGWEGYGLFWALIEKLRESSDYTSVKDYNIIAFDLRTSADKIKSIIEDFGLFTFTEDGKRFYSKSLNSRMNIKDELSQKRAEAGRKGMQNRWRKTTENEEVNSNVITNEYQTDNNVITNHNNKRKVKESKINNSSFLEKEPKIYICENSNFEEISESQQPNANSQLPLKTEEKTPSKKVAAKKVSPTEGEKAEMSHFSGDFKQENQKEDQRYQQGEKIEKTKEKRFDFKKALLEAGFQEELCDEWLKIRKSKKAINSELAFKNFMREVEKSGRNPNEILNIIVQKQWKGFEASWLEHSQNQTFNNGQNASTTSNYPNSAGTGQKFSFHQYLAHQMDKDLARNSQVGSEPVEIEAVIIE